MSFVHASLLFGGLLIAAPILLHLLMRRQPKRHIFPAIQFVKSRMEANRRTLQLRHWLLLLLRSLLIGLLAIALARPSVTGPKIADGLIICGMFTLSLITGGILVAAIHRRSGRVMIGTLAILCAVTFLWGASGSVRLLAGTNGAAIGDQEAPVAAVLIVDTSPRMEYRHQNQSRLEAAQQMGDWLIRQFPNDSQIAVLDTHRNDAAFAIDRSAAQRNLERLQLSGDSRRLTTMVVEALRLLETSSQPRREIYVFTDLTNEAWNDESTSLAQRLAEQKDVVFYLVDVGVRDPRNIALGDLKLSEERLPRGSDMQITADVVSLGVDAEVPVELNVEIPDPALPMVVDGKLRLPESQRRSREVISIRSGDTQSISLSLKGLLPGVHHGTVRVAGDDSLAVDDVRYFTVFVQDAWPILIVTGTDATAAFASDTLSPLSDRQSGDSRYNCRIIPQAALSSEKLESFSAVCLLDPGTFTDDAWERLSRYVENGGSVAMFLGHNASESAFERPEAQKLLGVKLVRKWRAASRELYLSPSNYEHPMLDEFRPMATNVPWDEFPVFMHWVLSSPSNGVSTVASFSNNQPAIVERTLGAGRVIIMTTPISDPARPKGRAAWNELFAAESPWPSFVLLNEMMLYLVERDTTRLNFATGESVALSNNEETDPERYQMFAPGEVPQDATAHQGRLSLGNIDKAGTYYLKGNRNAVVQRGFSANLPRATTDLKRIDPSRLDQLLGKGRFHLAQSRDEIVREVGEARMGREFYPYLLLMFALILATEQLLANRFYRTETPRESARSVINDMRARSLA